LNMRMKLCFGRKSRACHAFGPVEPSMARGRDMTITFDADDVAYFDEVHGRRSEALCPKPLQVVFRDGEAARPNDCHANAVRWAAQTPDAIPVHGWLIEAQDAFQLHIVAHSVVADEHGRLIDVTPMPT